MIRKPHRMGASGDKPRALVFDFYGTLGSSASHSKEPIWFVQELLGHNVTANYDGSVTVENDEDFLTHCLTSEISDPRLFLEHTASLFVPGQMITDEHVAEFERIVQADCTNMATFFDCIDALTQARADGYMVAVVSDMWNFAVQHIFTEMDLSRYFEPDAIILSCEIGHRKPDAEVFHEVCRRLGVRPEDCLMVGDNIDADIVGADAVGMQTAMIDRLHLDERKATLKAQVPEAMYVNTLFEVLSNLQDEIAPAFLYSNSFRT